MFINNAVQLLVLFFGVLILFTTLCFFIYFYSEHWSFFRVGVNVQTGEEVAVKLVCHFFGFIQLYTLLWVCIYITYTYIYVHIILGSHSCLLTSSLSCSVMSCGRRSKSYTLLKRLYILFCYFHYKTWDFESWS